MPLESFAGCSFDEVSSTSAFTMRNSIIDERQIFQKVETKTLDTSQLRDILLIYQKELSELSEKIIHGERIEEDY